ncbi:MAG: hypothetical protein E7266_04840 [Lachnospiraceae bacterium]|nr:hypothetical protein [Lachnospiraceae bacterium]
MNTAKLTKNIRISCFSRMFYPFFIGAVAFIILYIVPFYQIFFPTELTLNTNINLAGNFRLLENNPDTHCTITFPQLEYTGYDLMQGSMRKASYYYFVSDTSSVFVLLDSSAFEEPERMLKNYTVTVCRKDYDSSFDNMLALYSQDISWTADGLMNSSIGFMLSEVEHSPYKFGLLFIGSLTILFACLYIIAVNLLYILFPYMLHPCYRQLRKTLDIPYKKQSRTLRKLDNELISSSINTFGSTIITSKYLIDSNTHTSVILPIKNIIWVYSNQRIHKILGFTIKATSSMTFVLDNGLTTTLYRKLSDDARLIYSYLESVKPDILSKYSTENKIKAAEIIATTKKEHKKLAAKKKKQ